MNEPLAANEPIGPQAAAAAALEVEAVPDDGTSAAPGAQPPGAEAPPPDENVRAWDEAITFVLRIATRIAADRWSSMQTSDEEIAAVSGAWSPICARRWPLAMTPELAACLVTVGVFAPKVLGAVQEERTRQAAAKDAKGRAAQPAAANPAAP